jgi:hypothetical protein
MAVTVVFAGTADGDISSSSATYTTAWNGGGTAGVPAATANDLLVGQLNFGNYILYQSFVDFDLSAINPGQTVSSAVMQTWLTTDSSTTNCTVIAVLHDWGATVTSADWRIGSFWTGETWWTTIATNGIGSAGAYKSWSDTGDIRALCTLFAGGDLNFVLSTDRMVAGVVPPDSEFVVWANASTAGTTNDPKITITHAEDLLATQVPDGGIILGESTVGEFIQPNAPAGGVLSDIVVEWDFDNDGDFSESEEDITGYLIAAETVTGRDFPSGLTGETKPGQLKLSLLNTDNRFSYFAGGPLTVAPFSLRTGRKIRVRTSGATVDDPVLLARDRFNRADGALGVAETGQAWTAHTGAWVVRDLVAAANDTLFQPDSVFATLDTGETDHYVQATLRQLTRSDATTRTNGVIARFTDINNFTRFTYLTDTGLRIIDRAGGADTTLATYAVDLWEGVAIGVGIVNQTVTGYIGGAPVCTATLTGAIDGTRAGLACSYTDNSGRSPEVGDFAVFDQVAGPVDGVIWTGDVSDLQVTVNVDRPNTATLTADGRLARAAAVDVASPRLAIAGAATGAVTGDILHRAGLLHPPHPLDLGAVTTGCIGIADGPALAMARMIEDTEQGTLVETNEGPLSFQDSNARATAASMAWFSDTPGVGQYPYFSIVPLDRRNQLVNRVVAGVAPGSPIASATLDFGGSENIVPVMPTVVEGDLLVVFIVSSHDGNQDWEAPIWWTAHRDLKGGRRVRVYSHPCNAADAASPPTPNFRTWDGSEAGIWLAIVVRVQDWFKAAAGVKIGDFASGNDPGALVHGWGRAPTLFIVMNGGIRGNAGSMVLDTPTDPPDGYGRIGVGGIVTSGVTNYDVGQTVAYKVDCTESEDPTAYASLANAVVNESVVFAVRGFNGSHTKQTLQNPNSTGGEGRFVRTDNLTSQADYNAVLSHSEPSNLFATEADAEAYGESIVATYGQERQILELSFPAHKSAALRAQAIARRVGDKITVTATGSTGLGIEADFFIEAGNHKFSDGGTKWEVSWQLSPA